MTFDNQDVGREIQSTSVRQDNAALCHGTPAPAFQFYPKQWLGDDKVMLMDWAAKGMHLHLMCIAWQQKDHPCSLPNDDETLRKWVGNPRGWVTLRAQIFAAWVLRDGRWWQEGLLREYEKQQRFSASRRANAEARWSKKHDASAMQVQCEIDALQSSSSSSKEKYIFPQNSFDTFWASYPKRNGKIKAGKSECIDWFKSHHFEEWNELQKAIKNYAAVTEPTYIKDPIRFLKKDFWRDWINIQADKKPGEADWA